MDEVRATIIEAASRLLRAEGVRGVTTRAVAAAAGVQPPTIYRLFGDKDGLLDAVAGLVLQEYMQEKRRLIGGSNDPAVDLRRMWDLHIDFGLNEPNAYLLS